MKEHWRDIVLIVFVIALSIFLFSPNARTISESIIITEICPSGCAAGDRQWIEIYNKSADPIDLSNWKFWEGSVNHGLVLSPSSTITSTILLPGAYAVIAQNDNVFFVDHPEVTSTVFDSAWTTLNKTGEEIGIKKGSGGDEFVEKFVYVGVNNYSLERIGSDGEAGDMLQWKESMVSSTPGRENYWWARLPEEMVNHSPSARIEAPQSAFVDESVFFDAFESHDLETGIGRYVWTIENATYEGVSLIYAFATTGTKQITLTVYDMDKASSTVSHMIEILPTIIIPVEDEEEYEETPSAPPKIIINEFLSDPNSPEKEWIELYNAGYEDVLLDGFTLYDGVGKIVTVTGTIVSGGFKVLYLSSSKLNQTGDSIILKNINQEIIDTVVYGTENDNAPIPGKAHTTARVSDGEDSDNDHIDFAYTITPTPGVPNNITPKEVISSPTNFSQNNTTLLTPEISKPTFPEGSVLINEFVSIPSDNQVEFVELLNISSSSISLDGWVFQDGSLAKTILTGTIFSGKFFVIEKPKGSLNNSGDALTLTDPSGKEINRVVYGEWNEEGGVATAPTKGTSLMRIVDTDSGNLEEDFVVTETITKGSENIFFKTEKISARTSTLITTSSMSVEEVGFGIIENSFSSEFIPVIVEILPNPLGSDTKNEYIELFNPYDRDIYLAGLSLDDGEGGSKPYLFPEDIILAQGEYRAFYSKDTKLSLTNSGENVRILDPEGSVLSEVEYVSSKEGKSYTYGGEMWFWTADLSPGKQNASLPVAEAVRSKTKTITARPKIETSLTDVRNFDVGTIVSLTGTVVVEPSVLSSQYFYIAGSPGLQIYSYKKDFPVLARGDKVKITGELAETSGELRLKIDTAVDIQVIGESEPYIPLELAIADIDEPYEGWLVEIKGEVTGIKGSYVYLDDGTDEIRLYIRGGSGIDKSVFKEGIRALVTGIVQETKSGYMVSPRDLNDVVIEGGVKGEKVASVSKDPADSSKKEMFFAIFLTLGGLAIVLGIKLYGDNIKNMFKKLKK